MFGQTKERKMEFCRVTIVISILQREDSDANRVIFITVSAFERKLHKLRGPRVVISLACHQQKKSEVMFISVGVDSAALMYSCSTLALWTEEQASRHIRSTGLHSITAPRVVAVLCTHEDIKMWFCFTVNSLPDDLIVSESDIRDAIIKGERWEDLGEHFRMQGSGDVAVCTYTISQVNFILIAPNHNRSYLSALFIESRCRSSFLKYYLQRPNNSHHALHNKHLATVAKNSLLTEPNQIR